MSFFFNHLERFGKPHYLSPQNHAINITDFGYNLRKLREMHGLSPEQMGDIINVSARTWHKIESGERDMSRQEMKLVAPILQIPEELMMSLDKRPIFNSFNNHQEGDNNQYAADASPAQPSEVEKRVAYLEGRIDVLEKIFLNKPKEQ